MHIIFQMKVEETKFTHLGLKKKLGLYILFQKGGQDILWNEENPV